MLTDHRVHIAYDQTRIVYDLGGQPDSPPIVLCDGVGCAGFIWKYLARDLEDGYRLIHPNYRGHGRSHTPSDPEHLLIQDHCRDLLGILDQENIEKCVLIGHSMGVQTILEFSHRSPERVSGLVAICGSYGRVLDTFHGTTTLRTLLPHMLSLVQRYTNAGVNIWKFLARNPASWPLAKLLEVNGDLVHQDDMMPYFQHLARMNPRVFLKSVQSAANHSALPFLREISAPTLVVAGDRDQFTPRWLSEKLGMHLPNSELLVIKEGTHVAPLEAPKQVNSAILSFLQERISQPESELLRQG